MSVLVVYARLYAAALVQALRGVRRSPWTLLLPFAVIGVWIFAGGLLAPLGLLGSLLFGLALDALVSSYLYFVGEVVQAAKVRLHELRKSFAAYFWAVLNLFFVIWVVELVLGLALQRNPRGAVLLFAGRFVAFVLLNAAPEVIYQRHTYGGIATIQRSISFIHANWIEWFVPNLLLGAAFYFGLPALLALGVPAVLVAAVAGGLAHIIMVFRGHLFRELDSSTHRQRVFRYQTRGE